MQALVLAQPDAGTTDFLSRSVLGIQGPLWILDQLAAGLWRLVESAPGG